MADNMDKWSFYLSIFPIFLMVILVISYLFNILFDSTIFDIILILLYGFYFLLTIPIEIIAIIFGIIYIRKNKNKKIKRFNYAKWGIIIGVIFIIIYCLFMYYILTQVVIHEAF